MLYVLKVATALYGTSTFQSGKIAENGLLFGYSGIGQYI